MGEYTEIYVRTADGLPPRTEAPLRFVTLEPEQNPTGFMYRAKNTWRFSPGGDEWPETAETLMLLLTAPNVAQVWYFGDCADIGDAPENVCTIDDVREYTKIYLADPDDPRRLLYDKWAKLLDVPFFPRVSAWPMWGSD